MHLWLSNEHYAERNVKHFTVLGLWSLIQFLSTISVMLSAHPSIFLRITYEVHTISFQPFFVWAFKIGVDSWKFTMLLLYILCDSRLFFMISVSKEQLQQQLEYTLRKPDCHSWWISKIQSDNLEERYAIKFCFKLGKNVTETYGMEIY